MNGIYISNVHGWKPSAENPKEKPKLEFADPLFKRRLSQVTRMTVQVLHDLLQEVPETASLKQVFVSFRGEIEREFTINRGLIEDSEILPAGFSLSVFNTPVAAATLSLGLKAGYSVIYPSKENFNSALLGAAAPVLCGSEKKIIFVYADEYVPDEYGVLCPQENTGFAFACILSLENVSGAKFIGTEEIKKDSFSPVDFYNKVSV